MSDFMKSVKAAGSAVAAAASKILPEKNRAPLGPTPAMAASKKTAAPSDEIVTVALRAWQSPTMNTRILIAYPPGVDPQNPNNLVTVRVANNKNFIRHMQLRARRVQGAIYDLVGPLPRWKGRW